MDPQTAEAGEAYLNAMGFRSLIEWMTAEALLARPDDPLTFVRSLLEEKMGERKSGEKYQADHALTYIKQCYAAASASADENGRILIKPRKISAPPATSQPSASVEATDPSLLRRLSHLEKAIEACRSIGTQLNPSEATGIIIKEACEVLSAERATLFIYEPSSNMMVLKVSEGAADIRVPFGTGIAGTVAATGRVMNISDAYADPNFDSQYDQRTGYTTRSMLCVPVRNADNKIVGVVQVLNKVGSDKVGSDKAGSDMAGSDMAGSDKAGFSDMDEEILTILAAQAGVVLHNAETHALACASRERVKEVLAIVQDMHRDLGFNSLMFTISTRVQKFVNSDRCTLYIVDRTKQELWTLQGELNIRVPLNQGIAGAAALENVTINLPDAYDDPRFNKEVDQKHGYKTRSVLAMPLRNQSGDAIAVVQLINKLDSRGVFTSDDEELLGTFLQIAGPILESSQSHLPKGAAHAKEEVGTEFTGKSVRGVDVVEMNAITENEDEEETG